MNFLIVKKDKLRGTETFILRHASDFQGRALLVHGQPPRVEHVGGDGNEGGVGGDPGDGGDPRDGGGGYYEIGLARRAGMRLGRRLGLSTEASLNDSRYKRLLRERRPAVVLAEFGPSGVAVNEACQALGIPFVVFFHGYDLHVNEVRDAHIDGYRRLFNEAAAIICGAPTMREILLEIGAPPPRTFVCESSGIDCHAFSPPERPSHPPDEARFVHIGRFVDKKAPHLTLLAFAAVLAREPGARLDMVGSGRLLGASIDLSRALRIDRAVTFHGALPHDGVMRTLKGARAFVQHSVTALNGDSEGTALAVLEAGACGVPAVVTRHAGFKDTVVDGDTGFLVEERDVDAMAERMLFLARYREEAAAMGGRARARVKHYFNHERSIARLGAILEWAAGTESAPPPLFPEWARRQPIGLLPSPPWASAGRAGAEQPSA